MYGLFYHVTVGTVGGSKAVKCLNMNSSKVHYVLCAGSSILVI